MELHKKILHTIEENGFTYEYEDDNMICLQMYTPAGEDWFIEIPLGDADEDFVKAVWEYADNFDVDEETEMWIERRGQNGVPSSIRTLLKDAEWKKAALGMLAACLQTCLPGINKKIYAIRINETHTGVVLVEASEDTEYYGIKNAVQKAFDTNKLTHVLTDVYTEMYEDTNITEAEYDYYSKYKVKEGVLYELHD